VSLLLDENLSPRLVTRLALLFPGIAHVRDFGLNQAADRAIWEFGRTNGSTIITADSDFVALVEQLGSPPKVVYLERCDFPLRVIEDLLRRNAVRIAGFEKDDRSGLLFLHVPYTL
jgi:predicted nuclease of predicted toxin-antitoxin system